MTTDQLLLEDFLKQLRLPTMLRDYQECSRQAREVGEDHTGFLLALATRELEQRRANQLKRRLKEARFPILKTLEDTQLEKWVGLDALEIRELAEGQWIDRRENVILIGKHGTGKTHAAISLGVEACRSGHRVFFTTAAQMVNQLVEAREERTLNRYLTRIKRFNLLIIDELGYIPFSAQASQLLFQVLADRYEQKSVMITTNLPFSEWTQVFQDTSLTAALLDRLTHRCQIFEFDWESIRFAESLKKRRKAKKRAVAVPAPPSGANKELHQAGLKTPLDG